MTDFIEIPASNRSVAGRKLILGVGINDSDYITSKEINGKTVLCPIYRTWKNMLDRCYSKKHQRTHPTYIGCSVADEWLTFSNFKDWMIKQDWQEKQLDKDILIYGNKVYGPSSCIFVSGQINRLLIDCGASRGEWPQGVCLHKGSGKYQASCRINGKRKYLGSFNTPIEAEAAYLKFKSELIISTAYSESVAQNKTLQSALIRHATTLQERLKECNRL